MAKSRKAKSKKSTRKATRKIKLKKSARQIKKKVELKNTNLKLFVGNKLQTTKLSWVSISDGYIYISRDNNRMYWVLSKLKKTQRPKITFNDKKQIIKVGNNKIIVTREVDYNNSKALLEPYSK